ncbi:hypothetical protein V8F33_004317 [Rhypophila sp. PSN 637]
MMTSSRPRDVGNSFSSRRGHGSQLSISDPSHHVTEAIGTMYGDDDDSGAEDSRPLSFIASSYGGEEIGGALPKQPGQTDERLRLVRTTSDQNSSTSHPVNAQSPPANGHVLRKTHTLPARIPSQRSSSFEGPKSPLTPLSPTPSLRDVQADSEGSQFPLTNIDNPNDIAQELSNLQALRRMSMDVGNQTDPDLLPFSTMSLVAMPSIAPTGDDDEADPSRLLWVPARVHPELEPTAFKNFLENRVQSMKRRSGDSMLSVEGLDRKSSGLRRKKSMLSRQINTHTETGDGYADGADRLSRKYSQSDYATPELTLDELVKDPKKVVQRIAQETRPEGGEEDMPILPVAPGMGLRRSKRTQYRKGGSLRSGERAPFSKRIAAKQAEDTDAPPVPQIDPVLGNGLTRVPSEPSTENFSRPTRSVRRQNNFSNELSDGPAPSFDGPEPEEDRSETTSPPPTLNLPVRSSSAAAQRSAAPATPQIVETPPQEPANPARQFPQRSSSQSTPQPVPSDEPSSVDGPPARSSKRPTLTKPMQSPPKEKAASGDGYNLNEMANSPSPLPGGGASSTSSLTFIPTFNPEKKPKDTDTESVSSTKSSFGLKWFKSDDKEKKKREKEKEEQARKAKAKGSEKHDTARLDVIQSSIDNAPSKARESLVLDRESMDSKLHEERAKQAGNRKASDTKSAKDGFFGGLFGGSRKKGDKEPSHKKKDHRPPSPDPPPRPMRPDIDFPWTRFPIIEERAIYRMAHIKLANPRRPLHSQVLLSNFMYSYLAKVQAMHPQLNVPISPQQKRQEEERKRREAEQAALQLQQQQEMEKQMAQQQAVQDGTFDFDYHRSGNNQYGDAPYEHDGGVQYVDDSQIYEYEHGDQPKDHHAHQNGNAQDGYGHQRRQEGGYYDGRDRRYDNDGDENGDMW